MSIYSYEHTYAHLIFINTFKRLSRFNFEIHKVGHQKCLTIDGDTVSH
jgi:hypothetical protein